MKNILLWLAALPFLAMAAVIVIAPSIVVYDVAKDSGRNGWVVVTVGWAIAGWVVWGYNYLFKHL